MSTYSKYNHLKYKLSSLHAVLTSITQGIKHQDTQTFPTYAKRMPYLQYREELSLLPGVRAKKRLVWRGVDKREEWVFNECLKLVWFILTTCTVLSYSARPTWQPLPWYCTHQHWGSWVSGVLSYDVSAEANQATAMTPSCQVIGSFWEWKEYCEKPLEKLNHGSEPESSH